MYNKELKTKFINDYTKSPTTRQACISTFNAVEKYELKWGADICTKRKEDLQVVVDEITGLRVRNKWLRIIILKAYVKWCLVMGVPGVRDDMLSINNVGLDKVRQQTVASPLHLQRYLDVLFDKESDQTTDSIYRCFFWLAYSGIEEEDILKIKCSDVDFSIMKVHYNGAAVPLYTESLPAFTNCVNLSSFVYNHPNFSPDKTVYMNRISGDTIIRGVKNPPTLKTMRVAISKKAKLAVDRGDTDIRLSYYRAKMSGLFYRTYEDEQIGIPPDFSGVVANFMKDKEYKLSSGRNTRASKERKLAMDYMNDYQRWKLAYKF